MQVSPGRPGLPQRIPSVRSINSAIYIQLRKQAAHRSVLTSKPHPMGLGWQASRLQSGSETVFSVTNLVRWTSEIVSRGA